MVSFDFSVRSTLIEENVENEVALWTKEVISLLSINRGSSQCMRVQVIDFAFHHFVNVLQGAEVYASGCFFEFFDQETTKIKKQDCMQTYLFLSTDNSDRQLA